MWHLRTTQNFCKVSGPDFGKCFNINFQETLLYFMQYNLGHFRFYVEFQRAEIRLVKIKETLKIRSQPFRPVWQSDLIDWDSVFFLNLKPAGSFVGEFSEMIVCDWPKPTHAAGWLTRMMRRYLSLSGTP